MKSMQYVLFCGIIAMALVGLSQNSHADGVTKIDIGNVNGSSAEITETITSTRKVTLQEAKEDLSRLQDALAACQANYPKLIDEKKAFIEKLKEAGAK
jgi:hypothetical protein